ncbi:MAG: hypothetical protein WDN03_20260 [Rhizomicrobium sp.]
MVTIVPPDSVTWGKRHFGVGEDAVDGVGLGQDVAGRGQHALGLARQGVRRLAQDVVEIEAETARKLGLAGLELANPVGTDGENLGRHPGGLFVVERLQRRAELLALLVGGDADVFVGLQARIGREPRAGPLGIAEGAQRRQHVFCTFAQCALVLVKAVDRSLHAVTFGGPGLCRRIEIREIPHVSGIDRRLGGGCRHRFRGRLGNRQGGGACREHQGQRRDPGRLHGLLVPKRFARSP